MKHYIQIVTSFFRRDKKIILLSILIGTCITCVFTFVTKSYSMNTGDRLAEKFIRFHVIANSDREEDQQLKLAVRDAVLEEMSPILNESNSIEETREILNNHIEEIKSIGEDVIEDWHKNYNVEVTLGSATFPTKQYGDVVLPAGTYEALRIEIGEAKGKNWWCVMFPPLCFVDVTHGVVPEEAKEDLKNILTDEELDMVLAFNEDSEVPVKVKFKIVEWWQKKHIDSGEQVFVESK